MHPLATSPALTLEEWGVTHGATGILRPLPELELALDLDALWAELDELPEEDGN